MTTTNDTSVVKELANSYLEYSIATSNRSIPNIIDGLKTSQRRIVQSSLKLEDKWFKTAYIAGDVMKLHPHGSSGATIQNMADPSNYLNPLMDLHGNGGGYSIESRQKISDDNAAAERYTQSKLSKFGRAIFDIEQKYLSTRPSYDGSLEEVVNYVPALPLALVNGQSGIGTGWSTNTVGFPVKAIIKAISTSADLGHPDIPYNTNIIDNEALQELHKHGKASLDLVGGWMVDKKYDSGAKRNRWREALIITKLASGSAEQFIEKVKNAYENGKVEGIANIIDETSKEIRVIIVCKANIKANSLLPSLLKFTTLKSKFSAKFTLVNGGLPGDYTPNDILNVWYKARTDVLLVKFKDEKNQAEERLTVVQGLLKVFNDLRDIALLIMESDNPGQAKTSIINEYDVNEATADAILNIQLKKLTKLSRKELEQEEEVLIINLYQLNDLINNPSSLRREVVRLAKLAAKHSSDRVSSIVSKPNVKKCKPKSKPSTKADIIEKAIKKSVVKCPNGKKSPPIGKRALTNAVKKGMSIDDRVREHITYWKKKYGK